MNIEYLFIPNQINSIISYFKCIKETIDNPSKEGVASVSLPLARKTRREIYRIFNYQNEKIRDDILSSIDLCLKMGWKQPKLFQTRSLHDFESFISELAIATHLIKKNWKIESFDQLKRNKSVPDIFASFKNISCICEVYSPRDWDGFELLFSDLKLSILNIDLPLQFSCKIRVKPFKLFNNSNQLSTFNPWSFSDNYVNPSIRGDKIELHLGKICFTLNNLESYVEFEDKSNNVVFEISFHDIKKVNNKKSLPTRKIEIIYPPLTGFAPEKMFDRLVERRIKTKIKKNQLSSINGDHFRILFVDISKLSYYYQFNNQYYLQRFSEIVKSLKAELIDVEIIIFFSIISSDKNNIEAPIILIKQNISTEMIRQLIGNNYNIIIQI